MCQCGCKYENQFGDCIYLGKECLLEMLDSEINIKIEIEPELKQEVNFMGLCGCGCGKQLWKGMTVFKFGDKKIYAKCLEKYLKNNMEVL